MGKVAIHTAVRMASLNPIKHHQGEQLVETLTLHDVISLRWKLNMPWLHFVILMLTRIVKPETKYVSRQKLSRKKLKHRLLFSSFFKKKKESLEMLERRFSL